ncbi:MAG TPA: helix-hairpin-helix domain-containing protein [Planctomycetota bacterium]|jgi:DNA-directed RNA polymerase alpha subunit|nr:hypothetical protein [Planctomycetota bacterium]OQC22084.1 MAG: DNA-directed RNA polymerase subunit alpha [Planctomycetes bacterium ADurb.Bin069]NMD35100.1 hypothetical protein [Planctomycetota bacterium]HNR98033.1 helix-hairpin-helix domain-containing protein [Planctomycetota bacterium]HNU25782.1 helix-hairpin-helix domain-containing protein [Planctomycetota bacterium]
MAQAQKIKIRGLGLGARAESALRALGVNSVEKLLALDVDKVLQMPGYGKAVRARLLAVQKRVGLLGARKAKRRPSVGVLLSSLSAWARRCLETLGVKTLFDLAAVRFVDFITIEGFGLTTWREIASIRRHAIQSLGGIVVWKTRAVLKNPAAIFAKPPVENTLLALPLFSDLEPALFGTPKFAPEWRAQLKVQDLALSVRAFSLCERARVKTLGQLLLMPATRFLEERNSHYGTLQVVQDAVKALYLGTLAKQQGAVDYRSFKHMLDGWFKAVLRESFAAVASERFNARHERMRTYEEISKTFGITRARVGQILDKVGEELRRRQHLLVIDRFWNAAKQVAGAETVTLGRMARGLADAFDWQDTPQLIAVAEALTLNPDFEVMQTTVAVK